MEPTLSVSDIIPMMLHWRILIFFPKQIAIANSFLVRGGTLQPLLFGVVILSGLTLFRSVTCCPCFSVIIETIVSGRSCFLRFIHHFSLLQTYPSFNIPWCFAIKAKHIFYTVCDLLISPVCSGPIPEMSTSYLDSCKSYQYVFRSQIILPLQLYLYSGKVSFYMTEHFRAMNGIVTKWMNFFI